MDDTPRIEIRRDGPYIVSGQVPLTEMAPVHTFNGEPIEWHVLREIPTEGSTMELCRCGQSHNKPFCDRSHRRVGFDGTETADPRPYRERAKLEQHGDLTLADDKPLCFSAGFCGTRTTDVWRLLAQSDDPAKRQLMTDMVWRCPSGRLALFDASGNAIEPDLTPGIAVLPGGPLWVRGGIPITGSDGAQWESRNRTTLCRCGQSGSKPFCDGTHMTIHFDER